MFFLVFFLVSSTRAHRSQESVVESFKKQLLGSRKPARGTKGEVEAFDCDKKCQFDAEKCEKSGNLTKKAPKM